MSDCIIAPGQLFVMVCPCGGIPEHDVHGFGEHTVVCKHCFDGASDTKCYFGRGDTFAEAADDWNLHVEEELDDREARKNQLFKCCAKSCPGYPYKASDVRHPCTDEAVK